MSWKNKVFGLLSVILLFILLWKTLKHPTESKDLNLEINVDVARMMYFYKDALKLNDEQMGIMNKLQRQNGNKKIYAITPTYYRLVQKAELTRLSQTIALVPYIHWIVVEDSDSKTDLVSNILKDYQLEYTHLFVKTPPAEKLTNKMPRYKKHRGVEQRNIALKWLRENLILGKHKGYVYFMDDDNTYSLKVFKEILKVENVGIWPVGLVGGLNAEVPIVDKKSGKVTGFISGWKSNRPFAIDMAGFAINLDLILLHKEAEFSYKVETGFQESRFLSYFTTRSDIEPLADNCTKVYVWHTRTETPKVRGVVPGVEV